MLVTLKTTKRRTYQTVHHKIFKTEETTSDEEFDKAIVDFNSFEKELIKLLKAVRSLRDATTRLTSRSAKLTCLLAAHFTSDHSDASCKPSALELTNNMTHGHSVVRSTNEMLIQRHVIEPIESLLNEQFPLKKRRIVEHEGLRKDLESYRRRKKRLQDHGKDENDKEMMKVNRKLGRTQDSYTQMHTELLQDLIQTYNDRHKTLQPCYVALVVCQGGLHNEYGNGYDVLDNLKINGNDIEKFRTEFENMVELGGPNADELSHLELAKGPKGILEKMKSLSFKSKNGSAKYSKNASDNTLTSPASSPRSPPPVELGSPSEGSPSKDFTPNIDHFSPNSDDDPEYEDEEKDKEEASAYMDTCPDEGASAPPHQYSGYASSSPASSPVKHDGVQDFDDFSSEKANENPNMNAYSPPPVPNTKKKTSGGKTERVIAEHEYKEGDESDLSFNKGDIITVLQKIDDGWWEGSLEDGSVGWFPVTYVKPYEAKGSEIMIQ